MKNRLQIKYFMPTFPYTREEAIEYINYIHKYDEENNPNPRESLPAEPIAVYYGDSIHNSNVILAIGRAKAEWGADYFLIDTAKMNEDAEYLSGVVDEVKKVAYKAQSDITQLKENMRIAQDEIVNLWAKIGKPSNTGADDTLYGYINDKVGMIMGGEPITGLDTISKIATAIKNLRIRVSNNKEGIDENVTRINDIDNRVLNMFDKFNEFSENINSIINIEKEERVAAHAEIHNKIGDIAADKTVAQTILDERDRAKAVEDKLTVDVANNAKAIADEINNRIVADNTVRGEFIQADKDNLAAAKSYTDTAKEDAITTSKSYTNDREFEIKKYVDHAKSDAIASANIHTDDNLTAAKDVLRGELEIASKKLTVKSTDKSIIVGAPTTEGTELYVNIDGNTIVRNEDGILSVASDKLVQYNGINAIGVSDVNNGVKTISLKINENEKVITNDANGLLTTLSLKWVRATDGTDVNEIQLLGKNDIVISRIDVAEFIKTGILTNVVLNTDDAENPKLVFEFNTEVGVEPIILNVKDLVDIYTAGKGLELTNSTFNVKLSDTNEHRFLTIAEDGVKLSGIETFVNEVKTQLETSYVAADNQIKSDLTAIKNDISVNETSIKSLNETLAAEVTTRVNEIGNLQTQISSNSVELVNLKEISHVHNNKSVIDEITSEQLNLWNSSLSNSKAYADDKDIVLKGDIYSSFITQKVTNITPDESRSQTLIKEIIVEGQNPYFYVSNNTKDMVHEGQSLDSVINIMRENEGLKNEVNVLTTKISNLETQLAILTEKVNNMNLEIPIDDIKEQIIPDAVTEAKKAIISNEVFKAIDSDLRVDVDTENFTVTYQFSDDAVFMADYNSLSD